MQVIVCFAEVVRRVHRSVIADRVVNARGSKDTVVEDIGLAFANMFIEVIMNRIRQMECPLRDAVAYICSVVMNNATMFDVLERIDVRYRVINDGIGLHPNRVVRPEGLNGVAFTDAVFHLRY